MPQRSPPQIRSVGAAGPLATGRRETPTWAPGDPRIWAARPGGASPQRPGRGASVPTCQALVGRPAGPCNPRCPDLSGTGWKTGLLCGFWWMFDVWVQNSRRVTVSSGRDLGLNLGSRIQDYIMANVIENPPPLSYLS